MESLVSMCYVCYICVYVMCWYVLYLGMLNEGRCVGKMC
jgi:hypothetical protein